MPGARNVIIYTDPRYRGGQLVKESLLLDEWLSLRYPGVTSLGRMRLGPTAATVRGVTLPPPYEAMLQVLNWYADAIVIAPAEQLVVEAKVIAKPDAIGQVLFYQRLISRTAELTAYLQVVFQPVVLFAEEDLEVSAFARSLGVRVEIYTPPWIASYVATVQYKPRTGVV